MLASVREAVVVCSSLGDVGMTSWDLVTGTVLTRRPTCASPRHGLVAVGQHYLAASQIQRAGSVGRGEIFFWAMNKTQAERCYPIEPIIPVTCTSNGIYLAGGGLSGKLYIWEVSSLNLLNAWAGHQKAVSCLAFSDDDSLLISGADDGIIYVWPLLRVTDTIERSPVEKILNETFFLYCWAGHRCPITAVLCGSGGANGIVVSSSLDQTCKVWSLALGTLLQTIMLHSAINCAILDPGEQVLYIGTANGEIVTQDMNLLLSPAYAAQLDCFSVISNAHRKAVTALAFSLDGFSLISASEDGTIHIWDTTTGIVVRELFIKGPITNILVVSQTNMAGCHRDFELRRGRSPPLAFAETIKSSIEFQDIDLHRDPVLVLPASAPRNGEAREGHSYSTSLLSCQVDELEHMSTPAALRLQIVEMKGNRAGALGIAKQYLEQNMLLIDLISTILHTIVEKF